MNSITYRKEDFRRKLSITHFQNIIILSNTKRRHFSNPTGEHCKWISTCRFSQIVHNYNLMKTIC